jgi:hypothetical protein
MSTLKLGLCFALAAALLAAAPAYAAWYWGHGNSGSIEDLGTVFQPEGDTGHKAWGIDFYLDADETNWVYLPIPTLGSKKKVVRKIKLYFLTGSDLDVTQVDVYNGDEKVKEISGLSWNTDGVETVETIDLGEKINFDRGLSLTVQVDSGDYPVMGERRAAFFGAGANFVNK